MAVTGGDFGAPYKMTAANDTIDPCFVRYIVWRVAGPTADDDLTVTDQDDTEIIVDKINGTDNFYRQYDIWQNIDKGVKIGTIDSGAVYVFTGRPAY